MQVPEKLTLIGGSILLSSTLVFTLRSQISHLLPQVDNGIGSLTTGDTKSSSSHGTSNSQQSNDDNFNQQFQQAQKEHESTGYWGTAPFYVDGQGAMHVGSGKLDKSYAKVADKGSVKEIDLDGSEQAPQNSGNLFASPDVFEPAPVQRLNGLNHLDTSHVEDMAGMFYDDQSLSHVDLSGWDTSNVQNMTGMFMNSNITDLNISSFDTAHLNDMNDMFMNNNLHQITLGENTKLLDDESGQNSDIQAKLLGGYKNNNQFLHLDGKSHPGTWTNTNYLPSNSPFLS